MPCSESKCQDAGLCVIFQIVPEIKPDRREWAWNLICLNAPSVMERTESENTTIDDLGEELSRVFTCYGLAIEQCAPKAEIKALSDKIAFISSQISLAKAEFDVHNS